jgi:competence protein ComEC
VLANLAALPVVGALVMPMAVLALVFMPLGLEAYPLWVMGQGLDIVLVAATWVADLGRTARPLAAMPLAAPVAMVAGLLWLSLWQRAWRLAGVAAILAGFWIAPGARLPDVLIGADGKLIALKNLDKTLTLNIARAEKYTATRWLAKFGDPASLKMGVARSGIACDRQGCAATSPDGVKVSLVHSPAILDEECGNAEIVIVSFRMKGPCPSAKVFFTRKNLKRAGMHAIYLSQANGAVVFEVRTARFRQGRRPWNGREKWFKSRRTRQPPAPRARSIPAPVPEKTQPQKPVAAPLQVKI